MNEPGQQFRPELNIYARGSLCIPAGETTSRWTLMQIVLSADPRLQQWIEVDPLVAPLTALVADPSFVIESRAFLATSESLPRLSQGKPVTPEDTYGPTVTQALGLLTYLAPTRQTSIDTDMRVRAILDDPESFGIRPQRFNVLEPIQLELGFLAEVSDTLLIAYRATARKARGGQTYTRLIMSLQERDEHNGPNDHFIDSIVTWENE